jgi:hypothetical protein
MPSPSGSPLQAPLADMYPCQCVQRRQLPEYIGKICYIFDVGHQWSRFPFKQSRSAPLTELQLREAALCLQSLCVSRRGP